MLLLKKAHIIYYGGATMERIITEMLREQFLSGLVEEEKSNATIQKYLRDVKKFCDFAGEKTVTKELVISYKQYLLQNYKPASTNSMLAAVNRFLKSVGWFDCEVKPLKVQMQTFRPKEKELTKEEYFRLLKAAERKNDWRLYFLMETICATGIRVSELQFITVEAVREGRAVISLKGKTRIILIPEELRRELKKYAKKNNIKSGSIFITKNGKKMDRSNILHQMKALYKLAGVDRQKIFPHNLRHLFACMFYKEEKDLSHLADILGHSNVNTTRIYTCMSGEEQLRRIGRLGLIVPEKIETA